MKKKSNTLIFKLQTLGVNKFLIQVVFGIIQKSEVQKKKKKMLFLDRVELFLITCGIKQSSALNDAKFYSFIN